MSAVFAEGTREKVTGALVAAVWIAALFAILESDTFVMKVVWALAPLPASIVLAFLIQAVSKFCQSASQAGYGRQLSPASIEGSCPPLVARQGDGRAPRLVA